VILPAELESEVQMIPFARSLTGSNHWFVVTSQHCDVVHANSEAEPAVEVVVARAIPAAEPRYMHLRHPRELHLVGTRDDGSPQPVAVYALDRVFSSGRYCSIMFPVRGSAFPQRQSRAVRVSRTSLCQGCLARRLRTPLSAGSRPLRRDSPRQRSAHSRHLFDVKPRCGAA
jgi:hypothetical protein